MKHFCDDWIHEWCNDNGWTDLFVERINHYWAFPPGGVMPEPIPNATLRLIKAEKGLSNEEKRWIIISCFATVIGTILTGILASPMPLVLTFAFDAITVARLEVEDF